jgi:hypothetical protein
LSKPKVTIPKSPPCISPYANESEVVIVDNLSIENRLDRVQIHGSIDITNDKVGLENILGLKRQIDCIADYLKHADLPDRVELVEAKVVKNPFNG